MPTGNTYATYSASRINASYFGATTVQSKIAIGTYYRVGMHVTPSGISIWINDRLAEQYSGGLTTVTGYSLVSPEGQDLSGQYDSQQGVSSLYCDYIRVQRKLDDVKTGALDPVCTAQTEEINGFYMGASLLGTATWNFLMDADINQTALRMEKDAPIETGCGAHITDNLPIETTRWASLAGQTPIEFSGWLTHDKSLPIETTSWAALIGTTPIEYSGWLTHDRLLPIETTRWADLIGTMPIETIRDISLITGTPIETGEGSAVTYATLIEYAGWLTHERFLPIETIRNYDLAHSLLIESGAGLPTNLYSVPIEINAGTAARMQAPIEYIVWLWPNPRTPIETAAALPTNLATLPIETGAALPSNLATLFVESGAGVGGRGSIIIDYAGWTTRTMPLPIEFRGGWQGIWILPIESRTGMATGAQTTPIESGLRIAGKYALPICTLAQIDTIKTTPIESALRSAMAYPVLVETGSGYAVRYVTPIESGRGTGALGTLPICTFGGVAVSLIGALPIESRGGMLTSGVWPIETGAGYIVCYVTPIETGAGATTFGQILIEYAGGAQVMLNGFLPIEFGLGSVMAYVLPIETGTGMASSAATPIGFGAGMRPSLAALLIDTGAGYQGAQIMPITTLGTLSVWPLLPITTLASISTQRDIPFATSIGLSLVAPLPIHISARIAARAGIPIEWAGVLFTLLTMTNAQIRTASLSNVDLSYPMMETLALKAARMNGVTLSRSELQSLTLKAIKLTEDILYRGVL